MKAHLPHPAIRPSRQRGVSMIELLVSLLIFTFGMLGLAGLQTRTLVFNQSSLLRTQATALTDDILDRMRADRINALAGRWDTPLTTASSSVSGSALYQTDLKDWKQQVEGLLPSARASITTVTTAGAADFGTVTVVIEWDDTRQEGQRPGEAYTPTTFQTKTRL